MTARVQPKTKPVFVRKVFELHKNHATKTAAALDLHPGTISKALDHDEVSERIERRAKAYIEGYEQEKAALADAPAAALPAEPAAAPVASAPTTGDDKVFLVTVPAHRQASVEKILRAVGAELVEL